MVESLIPGGWGAVGNPLVVHIGAYRGGELAALLSALCPLPGDISPGSAGRLLARPRPVLRSRDRRCRSSVHLPACPPRR